MCVCVCVYVYIYTRNSQHNQKQIYIIRCIDSEPGVR